MNTRIVVRSSIIGIGALVAGALLIAIADRSTEVEVGASRSASQADSLRSRPTTSIAEVARRVAPSTVGKAEPIVNVKPQRQTVPAADVAWSPIGSVSLLTKGVVLVNDSHLAAVNEDGGLISLGALPGAGPVVAATSGRRANEVIVLTNPYSDLLKVWAVGVTPRGAWESLGEIPLAAYPSWSAKIVADRNDVTVLLGWAHGGHSEAELHRLSATGWVGRPAPAFGSLAAAAGEVFIGAGAASGAAGLWSISAKGDDWSRDSRFEDQSVRIHPASDQGVVLVQTNDGSFATLGSQELVRRDSLSSADRSAVDGEFDLPDAAAMAASRAVGSNPIRSGYLRADGFGLAMSSSGSFLVSFDDGQVWVVLQPPG